MTLFSFAARSHDVRKPAKPFPAPGETGATSETRSFVDLLNRIGEAQCTRGCPHVTLKNNVLLAGAFRKALDALKRGPQLLLPGSLSFPMRVLSSI